MKKSRIIIFCLSFVTLFSAAGFLIVNAQSTVISKQQIDKIKTNCVSAKNTLVQLHASDALLRVNQGQIYESISTKLMEGFNGRLTKNNYSNSVFNSITKNYNSMLDNFRSDYINYEEHLSIAISINCTDSPTQFYNAVLIARDDRVKLNSNVKKLNQYIEQYQLALDKFEKDVRKPNKGTGT